MAKQNWTTTSTILYTFGIFTLTTSKLYININLLVLKNKLLLLYYNYLFVYFKVDSQEEGDERVICLRVSRRYEMREREATFAGRWTQILHYYYHIILD